MGVDRVGTYRTAKESAIGDIRTVGVYDIESDNEGSLPGA